MNKKMLYLLNYCLTMNIMFSDYKPAKKRSIPYKPLNQELLRKAREERVLELKMHDVIREIIFYIFFLWILMVNIHSFYLW